MFSADVVGAVVGVLYAIFALSIFVLPFFDVRQSFLAVGPPFSDRQDIFFKFFRGFFSAAVTYSTGRL